jgi:tetratricopeptide (TPR) repeat protein
MAVARMAKANSFQPRSGKPGAEKEQPMERGSVTRSAMATQDALGLSEARFQTKLLRVTDPGSNRIAQACSHPNPAYIFCVHRLFTPLLRRLYILFGAFLVVYASALLVENSPWNKERLYRKLISGDHEEKISAVADLVYLRGQEQLVHALKARSRDVREIAINSLWDLWFHEAGETAFQQVQAARAATERQAFPEALAILTRVTQVYPDFAEGWNRRGTLYWQLGRYEKAIVDARRVLDLNPDHFGAWQGLGLCQMQLGDWEDAADSFRAALKINPHDQSLLELLWRCEDLLRRISPEPKSRGEFI